MNERRISAAGLSIRLLEEGQGPAMILLHGGALGCSADDWGTLLPRLAARGFRAIAYDQPGFGAADNAPDVSVEFRSRFVVDVLDALQIERASVVGHSQAGRIAFLCALDAPARVEAGFVVCTGSMLPPLGGERDPEPATHEPTVDETRKQLEAYVYDKAIVTDALVEQFQQFTVRTYAHQLERQASATPRAPAAQVRPTWDRLEEPSRPLTLIYGADDRGSVRERIALARKRYPKMPIHLLEQCGHFAQWDQPDTLATLLSGTR